MAAVAAAAGRTSSDGPQMARPLRRRGRGRPARPLLAARTAARRACLPRPTAEIEALRRQRLSGPAIARQLGLPVSTVGARAAPSRPRPARGARPPRRDHPLRARASRRTDPHRHQEARPLRRHRPPHHRRPHRPEQRNRGIGWEYRPRLPSTTPPASPSPQMLPDEKKESAVAFLEAAVAYYRSLRRRRRARHDRQRLLPTNASGFARRLPRPRPQAHPHPALHAARPTARPSASSRPPARMGLRHALPHLRRTRPRHARLAAPTTTPQAALRPRRKAAPQPTARDNVLGSDS